MNIAEKLTKIAENEQLVADANAELEEALYSKSEGGKSWYDRFWDAFQANGNRTSYDYAFYAAGGGAWTNANFNPKHQIKPTSAVSIFSGVSYAGDLTDVADVDFSQSTNLMNAFTVAVNLTRVGVVDCRAVTTNHITMFNYCQALETIDEIILKDDGTQVNNTAGWNFVNCISLKNVKITGKINFNTSFQYSPLTKESITSIVNALWENSSELTLTLKKSAKESAFTDSEWSALIATKPNWTISLV